ncbi:MAG: polysaccharide biosynthesis protein, partial [Burkholderiaceae bacterium]|nr:polysaccharide biosynthesis protein [Burkholderiaceae bacterium]
MVSRTEAKMLRMMLKSLAIPVLAMPRLAKRSVVIAVDAMLCVLSVWLAFYLRLGEWLPLAGGPFWRPAFAIFGALAFALPVFILSGLYRAIFRYSGLLATITVVKASVVYAVMYGLVFTVFGVEGVPRTIGIIQPMMLVVFVVASRAAARYWLGGFYRNELKLAMLPKVLIYGAGATGRQLADAARVTRPGLRVLLMTGYAESAARGQGFLEQGLELIVKPFQLDKLSERVQG